MNDTLAGRRFRHARSILLLSVLLATSAFAGGRSPATEAYLEYLGVIRTAHSLDSVYPYLSAGFRQQMTDRFELAAENGVDVVALSQAILQIMRKGSDEATDIQELPIAGGALLRIPKGVALLEIVMVKGLDGRWRIDEERLIRNARIE